MDKNTCIGRLTKFATELDALGQLASRAPLRPNEKREAQERLARIKGELRDEYQTHSTLRGQREMSEIEEHCYYPAVHEAFTSLSVKTNSIPNLDWVHQLYDARSSISYYLHQLRD